MQSLLVPSCSLHTSERRLRCTAKQWCTLLCPRTYPRMRALLLGYEQD